jgi:hypothetical protein
MVRYYTGPRKRFRNRQVPSFGWKYPATWSTVLVAATCARFATRTEGYIRTREPSMVPSYVGPRPARSLLLRMFHGQEYADG